MEKKTINLEVLKERIEKMKNSGNPLLKRMAEVIEKNRKLNTLNK
jgi:hypothetical protein